MRRLFALVVLLALALPVFADAYKVDPVHTFVNFKISHLGVGKVLGRFNTTTGSVLFDETDASKCSLELEVKADSIDTNNADRDKHLRNADFFNAKQFPALTFKSTKVEKDDKGYTVTGELTLHGVTKPLTVKFSSIGQGKGMQGEARVGGEATFTIKRSDFGMNFMVGPVGDEVEITVAIEAVKE